MRGDDPHCLVLRAGRHRYALVGPWSDRLRAGQQVTVTGDLRVNQTGPCGVPFLVLSVRPR